MYVCMCVCVCVSFSSPIKHIFKVNVLSKKLDKVMTYSLLRTQCHNHVKCNPVAENIVEKVPYKNVHH